MVSIENFSQDFNLHLSIGEKMALPPVISGGGRVSDHPDLLCSDGYLNSEVLRVRIPGIVRSIMEG